MRRIGAMVVMISALVAGSADATDQADIAYGKAVVEANCARCHAVAAHDESRHPEAPALRTLSQRYPIKALEEAFAEGIMTGHPDMPEFIASPEQINAIIGYIETLQK